MQYSEDFLKWYSENEAILDRALLTEESLRYVNEFLQEFPDLKKMFWYKTWDPRKGWDLISTFQKNICFAADLQKIQLESKVMRLEPSRRPKPGDEVMQRLTIIRDGRIWLSRYAFEEDNIRDCKLMERTSFSVSRRVADRIFTLVKVAFSEEYRETNYFNDHTPWTLTLTNAEGDKWTTSGNSGRDILLQGIGLSKMLRKELGRSDLFLFDENPDYISGAEGRMPGREEEYIFYNVRFSPGGKTYCYMANDPVYQKGDTVIVPVGKDNHESTAEIVSVEYHTAQDAPLPLSRIKHILRKA